MTTLFWEVATSTPVLAALAVLLATAFVVAHLSGLITWFWPQAAAYAKAAALLQVITAAALFFLLGCRVSDERAAMAQLQIDVRWSESQLEEQKATAEDAERIAREKAAETDELKGKVAEYEVELETKSKADPGSACVLSDDDINRLRALTRRAKRR